MKTVDTKVTTEVWVTNKLDEDVQVKLRRFPLSLALYAPNDPDGFVKIAWQRFDYCITDWKGFQDSEGKPLECNTDNKRMVFDFDMSTLIWVATEIGYLDGSKKKITKKKKKKT